MVITSYPRDDAVKISRCGKYWEVFSDNEHDCATLRRRAHWARLLQRLPRAWCASMEKKMTTASVRETGDTAPDQDNGADERAPGRKKQPKGGEEE